eukprot:scaffold47815_cov20-Tisochrysis_lutea.AAC.1
MPLHITTTSKVMRVSTKAQYKGGAPSPVWGAAPVAQSAPPAALPAALLQWHPALQFVLREGGHLRQSRPVA